MKAIDELVADFHRDGWKSQPMERALNIARESPTGATELAHRILVELPKGGTFQHAALSFVPLEEWPKLVEQAIIEFRQNRENAAAEAVVQYASLQCVRSLHPHLESLFKLAPNAGSYYETWPWRGSGKSAVEFLLSLVKEGANSAEQRRKAWMCILETRNPDLIREALEHAHYIDLNLQMRQFGLPESLNAESYLRHVGFEERGREFRKLYSESVSHLVFPDGYFTAGRPSWLDRNNHPTWLGSHIVDRVAFGGVGSMLCGRCRQATHTLVRFPTVIGLSGVTGLETLAIETCLSCLGWEEEKMYYRHEASGAVKCLASPGMPPQFPAGPLKATGAILVDHGERWQWQDWASANSRENLNRIGGHPTWVQSAEYPKCPNCDETMVFLLQLDSDLPTEVAEDWLWGSGGIAYVFWCDACKVSGQFWQCT